MLSWGCPLRVCVLLQARISGAISERSDLGTGQLYGHRAGLPRCSTVSVLLDGELQKKVALQNPKP